MSTNAGIDFLKQYAASDANGQRPSVGKHVQVEIGRRKGARGQVTRHIRDPFGADKWRYCSDMQAMMRDITGRYGFRVQIETATHGTFWIDAEKVTVLSEEEKVPEAAWEAEAQYWLEEESAQEARERMTPAEAAADQEWADRQEEQQVYQGEEQR